MKRKRLASFGSALVLSLSSLLIFTAPHVFAATATWDGGGTTNNLTDAVNWAGDVAPLAGDDLVFPANQTKTSVTNDFPAGTSFNSITFDGNVTSNSNYTLTGSSITLVAGITGSTTGNGMIDILDLPVVFSTDQTLSALTGNYIGLNGVVSGSGNLTKTGVGEFSFDVANTFTGSLTINAGKVTGHDGSAFGSTAAGTVINEGGSVDFGFVDSSATIAEPLTLNSSVSPIVYAASCVSPNNCPATFSTNFTGPITLLKNALFDTDATITISGPVTGSFTMQLVPGSTGHLVINSSNNNSSTSNTSGNAATTTTVSSSDNQPTVPVTVSDAQTYIINGTRGATKVNIGGILKGIGTVGNLNVLGKLAPGQSPGCLSSGNLTFVSGSSYDFEVSGPTACTEYDQIKVTGTVDLGNGTLNTILYNGFKPTAGQSYVIISNDGAEAVTGTFNNLAEGATFTVGGNVLKISYTGGDGNDVALTVQSVPTTPNTGFSLVSTHPLQAFLAITGLAAAIALIARRYSKVLARQ